MDKIALKNALEEMLRAERGSGHLDAIVHMAMGAEVTASNKRMGYAIRRADYYVWASDHRWCSMPRLTTDLDSAYDFATAVIPARTLKTEHDKLRSMARTTLGTAATPAILRPGGQLALAITAAVVDSLVRW